MVGKMARSISPWWHGVVNGILPSNTNCAHASALHWSTTWTQQDMCSALGPLEYPLNGYVSGCIQRQAFVTFKHSHQGHTKKPKISGRPNRRFFSSRGLLRPYFAPLESVVSKWPDLPIMVRRSEQNLAFKGPFCRCFGIVLKHSMDTTRHVFCSRAVRISFGRVCFRLHPASSLCYIQTFPPRDIPRNQRYIPKISGRPNRRFFSSLGYCVPYFAPLESVVSKWPDLPIMVRRSEQNLALQTPFFRILRHCIEAQHGHNTTCALL